MKYGQGNERLLRAGAAVLLAGSVGFSLIGLIQGESGWFAMAAAGVVASLGSVYQLVTKRYRLALPVIWSATIIAIAQGVIGLDDTVIASGSALVALGGGATLMAGPQRQWVAGGAWGLGLIALAQWWHPADPWPLGLGLAGGFIFLLWALIEVDVVYRRNAAIQRRNDEFLDRSDISILRFDFSAVMPQLAELAQETSDVAELLINDTALLDRLFGDIWIAGANDAARRALRIEGRDFPLRQPPQVQPLNRNAASTWLAALAGGAREWSGVVWFPGVDESGRWYQLRHLVPTDDEDYSLTVVTGMDITAVMEAQVGLHKLDEAKNEFIATITHEMRTPLAGVVGFSSELDDYFDTYEPGVIREMVGLIRRQSAEIAHILDDLMAVAAAEMTALKVDREAFNVSALVSEMVDNVGLTIKMAGFGDFEAVGDPMRVRQILRNLLTNMDRYGGPNRRIEITSDAQYVAIGVIDDGPGLSDGRVKEIFSKYGVVDRSEVRGSMGLGLNVSRTLAHLMGASLEYHRIDDETHFVLSLPTQEQADAPTYAP